MDFPGHSPLLERLFTESAGELARYFTRRHGGEEVARDLVQQTFLEMARGLHGGKAPVCARGYLFGIARHLSQALWMRAGRERLVPFEAAAGVSAPECDERVEAAREMISALEPLQREILELRFAQGLSYAEMAEALSIPIGTVRSRLHHAVAEVRRRLQNETLA